MEPLNPATLCALVRKSISGQEGLKNAYDGVAVLVHACMLSTGFKFIGLGEDQKVDKPFTSEDASSLPPVWNESSASMYAFRYTHSQSSMEFIVRISRLGRKTMVFGIALGDDKTCSFDVLTQDFTSENFYPWKPEENAEALANGFISMSRIKDFSALFKINILQKLIPGLNKEGYTEEQTNATSSAQTVQSGMPRDGVPRGPVDFRPPINYDPLMEPRRRLQRPEDWPPEGDDEYEMLGSMSGPRFPGNIGADDLRPPGIDVMDPFQRRQGGHRGMHPTGEDLMRPYGTPTFPSPGMPPAGARYDPVFPGDRNGLNGRGGRGLGQGGFTQFGGSNAPMDSDAHDSMFS